MTQSQTPPPKSPSSPVDGVESTYADAKASSTPSSLYDLATAHALSGWSWSEEWFSAYKVFLDQDLLPAAGDRVLVEVLKARRALANHMPEDMSPAQLLSSMFSEDGVPLQGLLDLIRPRLAQWPQDFIHLANLWTSNDAWDTPIRLLQGLSDAGVSFHRSPSVIMCLLQHSPVGHPRVPRLLQELRQSPSAPNNHTWLLMNVPSQVSKSSPDLAPDWRINVLSDLDWPRIWASDPAQKATDALLDLFLNHAGLAAAVWSSWSIQHPETTKDCANKMAKDMFNETLYIWADHLGKDVSVIRSSLAPILAQTDPKVAAKLGRANPEELQNHPVLQALVVRAALKKELRGASDHPAPPSLKM